jgi:hypothetical protein
MNSTKVFLPLYVINEQYNLSTAYNGRIYCLWNLKHSLNCTCTHVLLRLIPQPTVIWHAYGSMECNMYARMYVRIYICIQQNETRASPQLPQSAGTTPNATWYATKTARDRLSACSNTCWTNGRQPPPAYTNLFPAYSNHKERCISYFALYPFVTFLIYFLVHTIRPKWNHLRLHQLHLPACTVHHCWM